MHDQIARVLYHLQVHLLFASLVSMAAWILTSIPKGSATTKYWIWVATALNFILPTGAVLDKFGATHFSWATPLGVLGDAGVALSRTRPAMVLAGAWMIGAVLMLARLSLRITGEHRAKQALDRSDRGKRSTVLAGIPVRFSEMQAPAVYGVLRPHITLPEGIDDLLSEPELNAVLIHELTHARRRDNLIRLVYEAGRCLLWFHPLVWVAGGRLALYRELSCDESVMHSAHGGDLVSALAKLANPEQPFLLQASASSLINHRLALLTSPSPEGNGAVTNIALMMGFGAVLLAGLWATVAHTACCWRGRL